MVTHRRDCVLLAGGRETSFASQENISIKALLKINGREMISFVLQVLTETDSIGRLVVVGNSEKLDFLKEFYPVEIIPEESGIMDNLVAGLNHLRTTEHVFVCSADIPFITRQAIEDFLLKCRPYQADIYYPVVERKTIETCFPRSRRTYVKTRDGVFSGGNIFLIKAEKASRLASVGRRFIAARKNPLKIAFLLGPGIVWRFVSGHLNLNYVEEYVFQRFGLRGKIIVSAYPGIACDIDKQADISLAGRFRQPNSGRS